MKISLIFWGNFRSRGAASWATERTFWAVSVDAPLEELSEAVKCRVAPRLSVTSELWQSPFVVVTCGPDFSVEGDSASYPLLFDRVFRLLPRLFESFSSSSICNLTKILCSCACKFC